MSEAFLRPVQIRSGPVVSVGHFMEAGDLEDFYIILTGDAMLEEVIDTGDNDADGKYQMRIKSGKGFLDAVKEIDPVAFEADCHVYQITPDMIPQLVKFLLELKVYEPEYRKWLYPDDSLELWMDQ